MSAAESAYNRSGPSVFWLLLPFALGYGVSYSPGQFACAIKKPAHFVQN